MKNITIVATTYFPANDVTRRQVASDTVASWEKNLLYEGIVDLHLADDGSRSQLDVTWARGNLTRSQQKRCGVGASLNRGFARAFETSPLVLYAVDDWMLTQPFDVTPWAKLLLERNDVGMVRLGPPHPGISGKVETFTEDWQGWGLRLDRHNFAFGHRPALYHQRLIEFYGWFEENTNALECERLYNEQFVSRPNGPDIVFALPHAWYHMSSIELSSVDPA